MFVLRRITSENLTSNTAIGDSYIVVDSERNQKDFNFLIDSQKCDKKDVHGFVSYNEGSKVIPLYKKSVYFVMVSNGRTFENISYK